MNDKIMFREVLSELRELAEANANKLTLDEINIFLKEVSLSDEQLELVYSYLEANKITIEGHKKSDAIKLFEEKEDKSSEEELNEDEEQEDQKKVVEESSLEEDKYLSMYLEELSELNTKEEKERNILLEKIAENDPMAKSRLIESYLPKVVDIAKQFVNRGLALSDLIQEGNIGLMLTLDDLLQESDLDSIEERLEQGIITVIEDAIEEVDSVKIANKQIVSRVNYLNEGARNLEEEMGRTVNIEELARYLEMSQEEVADIIRVSDDEIVVMENKDKKDDRE